MQPYFDPTRKTTSKKNEKRPKKKWKMEDDLKKMKMEDDLNFKAVLTKFCLLIYFGFQSLVHDSSKRISWLNALLLGMQWLWFESRIVMLWYEIFGTIPYFDQFMVSNLKVTNMRE